jgi:hypothetical protein
MENGLPRYFFGRSATKLNLVTREAVFEGEISWMCCKRNICSADRHECADHRFRYNAEQAMY